MKKQLKKTVSRKQKKLNKPQVIVNFILDKSGSMESIKQATISGFNEYLKSLKREKGIAYSFSLTLFDTTVSTAVENKAIKDVEELTQSTYTPDGMTALYDAVCSSINATKASLKDKKSKVLTVIMTDGEENASKEYDERDLKSLIADCQRDGNWSFVFLGANQDAWMTANKFGIGVMNTSTFSSTNAGINVVYETLSTATRKFAFSAGDSTSSFFSANDLTKLKTS